jgi:hypothetical protein
MIVAQSVSREENPSKPTAACVTFALIPQRKAPRSHEGVAVIAEPTAYFSPDVIRKNDMRQMASTLEFQKRTDRLLMR